MFPIISYCADPGTPVNGGRKITEDTQGHTVILTPATRGTGSLEALPKPVGIMGYGQVYSSPNCSAHAYVALF